MNNIVIVPSSKYVPHELRMEFGHIPPVLLPINNKTIMQHLVDQYRNDIVYVGIHEGQELVTQYHNKSRLTMNLIDVGKSESLSETILNLMSVHSFQNGDTLTIHLGDTVLVYVKEEQENNCIIVSEVNDPWRWTIIDHDNEILKFIDKEKIEGTHLAVVGVFHIAYPDVFQNELVNAINHRIKTDKIDPFFSALQTYHQKHPMTLKEIERFNWLDLGHLDRFYEARGQTRSFNHTEIDYRKGIITKYSENKDKFVDEIRWYLKLPEEVQYTIPRIFDYSLDPKAPYIKMEYYGYPTLAERYVTNNLDLLEWENIFSRLQDLLFDYQQFHYIGNDLRENRYKMYVEKLVSRLKSYTFPIELQDLTETVDVNGRPVCTLNECLASIESLFENLYDSTKDKLPKYSTIMHGDFCFSNILFDIRTGIIRTIDPRGSFGGNSIYGDPLYDIAKLSHSIRGHYDFLIREQFYFEQNGQSVVFATYTNDKHEKIASMFEEMFLKIPEIKLFVDFIEATLFLSMLPLHSDSMFRQKGILVTGLLKFNNVLERIKETTVRR